jgi:hypothetical protein
VLDGVGAEERVGSVDVSWMKELFNSTASQGLICSPDLEAIPFCALLPFSYARLCLT